MSRERLTEFDDIIEQVLEHEGGYVDDPADKGGATNFGVIQRTYQDYINKHGDGHRAYSTRNGSDKRAFFSHLTKSYIT